MIARTSHTRMGKTARKGEQPRWPRVKRATRTAVEQVCNADVQQYAKDEEVPCSESRSQQPPKNLHVTSCPELGWYFGSTAVLHRVTPAKFTLLVECALSNTRDTAILERLGGAGQCFTWGCCCTHCCCVSLLSHFRVRPFAET